MLTRGSRVHDEYEVWGLLGEGGMSEVWLAKHAVLCIPVVIKTLRRAIAEGAGEERIQRMFTEARLLARVSSSHVVRAIDAGTTDGIPYFVQEYIDGIDLAELDRTRRGALGFGLPLWFVASVMADTCRALHAAHQAGVIHRDVKPSNLFAAPDAGIRLGDFGIAVARADAKPSEISGTIRFMAPEQLRGGDVDRRTDVYAAGATAYDLRYGHPPFSSLGDVLDVDRKAPFAPPLSPGEAYFQHVLATMLAKAPDARYADALEAAQHFALLARSLRPTTPIAPIGPAPAFRFQLGACEITLRVGDLALAEADGIVSSAHDTMAMRNGVGEALRLRGGDAIEEEAMKGGEQPLGTCVVTTGGELNARHVIHAVSAWNETSCIGRTMERALLVAERLKMHSLALPALGTGSSRVTIETCARAMAVALRWHLYLGASRLQRIDIVLVDEAKLRVFRDVAEDVFRGVETAHPSPDFGLPAHEGAKIEDAATCVDTSHSG
jgi:O-acetyl-ADP-ribose deacetylase (regulator of RNase III)